MFMKELQPSPIRREIVGFEATRERLSRTLGELVRFQTVADGHHADQFRNLFNYVGEKVHLASEEAGKSFLVQEWDNNGHLSTIIAPFDVSRTEEAILHPKIAMLIHADVVDAEDSGMFTTKKDGDTLYGRGVYDMKQGLAIGLDLLPEMPVGSALIITSDEEVGGAHGAQFLAQEVGIQPDFLIILDGQKAEHISFGAKAIWQTKVTFNSLLNRGGHGSRREDYSAYSLGRDMDTTLEQLYPWQFDESPQGVTYNIGQIRAGEATNKVPQHAEFAIDMRFPTDEEKTRGKGNLQHVLERVVTERFHSIYADKLPVTITTDTKEIDGKETFSVYVEEHATGNRYTVVTCQTTADVDSYAVDPQNRGVQRFLRIVEEITGEPVKLNPADTGGNDGTNWPNTPAILYMPKGGGAHKNDEWVSATSLVQTREAIKDFLQEELVA